jgi:hypothetical protein
MKLRSISVACWILLSVISTQGQANGQRTDPISGTWRGEMGSPGSRRFQISVELKFDGNGVVSGAISGPGRAEIKTGTFDSKTGALKFAADVKSEGGVLPFAFEGTVVQDTITGRVSGNNRVGDFKIAKVPSNAQTGDRRDDLDDDRAAIRADVEAIVQAYLDGDVGKIYSTHSKDWTGFLGRTQIPIKGLDEYMSVQGFRYPPPTDAPKSKPNSNTPFRLTYFDVNFITPDVGVANLVLEYGKQSGSDFVATSRMRITDVYAKRDGKWIQVASHSSGDPGWQSQQPSAK